MKLWDKGFSIDQKIDFFTVGNDRVLDMYLAKYDVIASIAHAKMLGKIGLLKTSEVDAINKVLQKITVAIEEDRFTIEDSFEDVHSKIEYVLTEELGVIGKKIHTARSRNDQVLVALHLYFKDALKSIRGQVSQLFDLLLELAEKNKDVMLPGYTHLQIAMPSSFGLWFSAYAESFIDDLYLLDAAFKVVDQNPLGSAAGYGSSFPIDRGYTTQLLGFSDLKYNVVAAQMSRGKSERILSTAIASIAATLGKMAMDICLYMCQNFDFINFPDAFTTGSSIMPHKKNPDVFELIRGKCNILQTLPQQLAALTINLPSGYHRDLQLTKDLILPGIETLKSCLEMSLFTMKDIRVNPDILGDKKYDYLFTVDTLNTWVQQGIPFREAYQKMGQQISKEQYVPKKEIKHTHSGSMGNLSIDKIRLKMNNTRTQDTGLDT